MGCQPEGCVGERGFQKAQGRDIFDPWITNFKCIVLRAGTVARIWFHRLRILVSKNQNPAHKSQKSGCPFLMPQNHPKVGKPCDTPVSSLFKETARRCVTGFPYILVILRHQGWAARFLVFVSRILVFKTRIHDL